MKRVGILFLFLAAASDLHSVAQASAGRSNPDSAQAAERALATPELSTLVPAPRVEDVKSKQAILAAIYDVISGPIGDRDWKRFRSLFIPQARFTALNKDEKGNVSVTLLGVEEFIQDASAIFQKEAFYERPIVNRIQTFGNMAQVFSSYESRHAPGGTPFERGINSIQMLNDGKRWWVVSILWDAERPGNPLPAEFATPAKAH